MLIDRADGVINVSEMKFWRGEFSIGDTYAKRLRNMTPVGRGAVFPPRQAVEMIKYQKINERH